MPARTPRPKRSMKARMATSHPSPPPPAGFMAGCAAIVPVLVAAAPFGVLMGALARQKGLSPLEVGLMSGTVFAGGAQFVAVGLWTTPAPWLFLALTALLVNLRHVLMGASIAPHLRGVRGEGALLFFLADEVWALALRRALGGRLTAAFYLGLALPLYLNWVLFSLVGAVLGDRIGDPARFGFDFAFAAIFIALLAGMWRGPADLPPWLASAVAATAACLLLPPPWYILAGALAGMAAGALRPPPSAPATVPP